VIAVYVDESTPGFNLLAHSDSNHAHLTFGYRWRRFGALAHLTLQFVGFKAFVGISPQMAYGADEVKMAAVHIDLAFIVSARLTLSLRIGVPHKDNIEENIRAAIEAQGLPSQGLPGEVAGQAPEWAAKGRPN
jgi:hypothetical protein